MMLRALGLSILTGAAVIVAVSSSGTTSAAAPQGAAVQIRQMAEPAQYAVTIGGKAFTSYRYGREFADKRTFPAIDVSASSTRREELLVDKDELAIVWKLRRLLAGLEGQQGLELVLDKLKKSTSNAEFLLQINKTLPEGDDA